ncbi:unnamed protein product [Closterium sp. Yama58-4]|nr:unnamed protein product [Closterium sp. Yama58-4]
MAAVAPSCSLRASTVPSTVAGVHRRRTNACHTIQQPSTILPAISGVSSLRLSVAPSTRVLPAPSSQHRHSRQSTYSRVAVISAAAASDTPEDASPASSPSNAPVERVLVVGASGGVGQLCVASLVAKNRAVRALVRSVEKAESLFADAPADLIQIVTADLRQPGTISPALFTGISAAIVCVGTTAFPSKRWDGDNGPEQTGAFPFHARCDIAGVRRVFDYWDGVCWPLLEFFRSRPNGGSATTARSKQVRSHSMLVAILSGVLSVIGMCCGPLAILAFLSKRWDQVNGLGERTTSEYPLAALPHDLSRIVLVLSAGVKRYNQLPYSIHSFPHMLMSPSSSPLPFARLCRNYIGVKNLLAALPKDLSRIVFVSSAGVERYSQLPYSILNLFGVLKYKKMAEDLVKSSGIPYTILRPGRLTDGPYTSYDLNTLLKATAGMRKAVEVRRGSDTFSGETSRVVLAEGCVQALGLKAAENEVFEMLSVEGEGPGGDESAWEKIFASAPAGK